MNDNSNANIKLDRRSGLLIALAISALLTSGCSLFDRQTDFDRISQERPLEIPPDLDAPPRTGALDVPGATASGSAPAEEAPGRLFLVDDTADSTYRRVGLALERLEIEVDSQDDPARSYVVDYVDEEAREQRPGVFSRWILRKKGPADYSGLYRLQVSPNGRGSAVSIEADSGGEAPTRVARDIMGALETRLGEA